MFAEAKGEKIMHDLNQFGPGGEAGVGSGQQWSSAERWADAWFRCNEPLCEAFDLMPTQVIARVHQHVVAGVNLSMGCVCPTIPKQVRTQKTRGIAIPGNWHGGRWRLGEITKALQQQLDQLLQYSCIKFGKVTLVVAGGKVLAVIPAPCIKRKAEELAVLAKFYVAR
jgi:hypothetical protein